MASTFYGLTIATSGLFTARKQIDIAGHNVANVNTPGYSRQRLITASMDPPIYEMRWAPLDEAHVGQGVQSLSLDQIRDKFLDIRYRVQNSDTNYWSTKADQLYFLEDVLYPTDGVKISQSIQSFLNSWTSLEKGPNDLDARNIVRQQAYSLVENLHKYDTKMNELIKQQEDEMDTKASYVNDILSKITTLNENIYRFEMSGQVANDLRDKRNLLLDELSGYAKIDYHEDNDALGIPRLQVYMQHDGTPPTRTQLISHKDMLYTMEMNYPAGTPSEIILTKNPDLDPAEYAALPASVTCLDMISGQFKAHMDLRDGSTEDNKGIPYFRDKLNKLVNQFIIEVNSIHTTGYKGSDSNVPSALAAAFFTGSTLGDIDVHQDIKDSALNIACSTSPVQLMDDGTYTGNQEIITKMKGLRERTNIPNGIGSFDTYFASVIGELSVFINHTNDMSDAAYTLRDSIENQRVSVMGVSLDEEMADLMRFQHAYNAAARSLTTMDEMLDTLISRTGVVGR